MNDEFRWYLLKKKQTEVLILNTFRRLRHENIEPILIKGWAAARNYPNDKPRFSIDVDLAVAAADFEMAKTLLATPDYSLTGVDLHRELRHLDPVEWPTLVSN